MATTPAGPWPAASSPSTSWPAVASPRGPPAPRPSVTPRFGGWRWRWAISAANSRPAGPRLQAIVNDLAPGLSDRKGVGPVSAAQVIVIVSFSHPGRCRNEAAFAALGGISPVEASSGRTTRHRLNRGGDRALNRVIHTIANTRMQDCPVTRAYVARRIAEGKNEKEIRRCLKRYIACWLHRFLTAAMAPA